MSAPFQFGGVTAFSEAPLQPGSRFMWSPFPTSLEFESAHGPSGEEYIVFVIESPTGVLRFGWPKETVAEFHRILGDKLAASTLQVAHQMPPDPPAPSRIQ